jgi:hypothetical protein
LRCKTAADFKGRKLGVTSPGSSTDFLTQALAAKGGLTTADYTTVKAGAAGTFVAAITNGGIDAGMTTDPTAAQLLTTGQAKVLLDMRTEGTRAALGGLYPAASHYAECAWRAQAEPSSPGRPGRSTSHASLPPSVVASAIFALPLRGNDTSGNLLKFLTFSVSRRWSGTSGERCGVWGLSGVPWHLHGAAGRRAPPPSVVASVRWTRRVVRCRGLWGQW